MLAPGPLAVPWGGSAAENRYVELPLASCHTTTTTTARRRCHHRPTHTHTHTHAHAHAHTQQVNDGPVTFLLDSADPNNQVSLASGASMSSLSSADAP